MEQKQMLQELERLVIAMEESLAIVTGTIAEAAGPAATLHRLLEGNKAFDTLLGPNDWRDRLLRSSKKLVAMKALTKLDMDVGQGHSDDPLLRSLIATVLAGRLEDDPMH